MWKKIKNSIPNTITSLNLFSGCVALVFIFSDAMSPFSECQSACNVVKYSFVVVAFCIYAAAFFDFCDGLSARALKAYSPLGVQLDSLADMVSFGVVPAAVLHKILFLTSHNFWLSLIPFIVAVFSALRLAKFNIDERQHESFLGLPTPACSIFVVSTAAAAYYHPFIENIFCNEIVIIALSIVLSALLVCEIPMFSLKIKPQQSKAAFVKKYILQISFLIVSLIAIVIWGFAGVSLAILLYILISIFRVFTNQKKQ